jgi:hypothetical protein
MLVPDITIYDALKGLIGEEKARQVVSGIKTQVTDEFEMHKGSLATKEDILKLDTKISETKAEIIKWTFTFVMSAVVINILAMLGAVLMVANIMKK